MLIIDRKQNDNIYIETPQGPIQIHIKSVNSKRVSIGLEAPKEFTITRSGYKGAA